MVVSGHHTNVKLEMSNSQEIISFIENLVIAAIFLDKPGRWFGDELWTRRLETFNLRD